MLTAAYQSRFAVRAPTRSRRRFSRRPGLARVGSAEASPPPAPHLTPRADLPTLGRLRLGTRHLHRHARTTLPRHAPRYERVSGGAGILTGCPSPTPLGLGLGPTNPPRINLPEETLGFRWGCFAHPSRYSCRHSHSHPLQPSSRSAFAAGWDAPLPIRPKTDAIASVAGLSPGTLSAPDHSTSELLRTLSRVAASEPTSWLSGRPDIL